MDGPGSVVAIVLLLAIALAVNLHFRAAIAAASSTARPACRASRRRSRSSATPTRFRTSSRRPRPTRCSASATCTRRIGCGRWSSSAASATAACRKFSAPPRFRRIAFCAPSASDAPRAAAWAATPAWAQAADQRLRRRHQCLHLHPSRQPASSRVLAAAVRTRAVERTGRHRLGEDDGLGPERELFVRAAAPRSRSRGRRREDGAAAAALPCGRIEHPAETLHHGGHGHERWTRPGTGKGRVLRPRDNVSVALRVIAVRRRRLSGGNRGVAQLPARRGAKALGSNNWVVDGTLTASGKPLLANDPHLGTRLPSTWYLAHCQARRFRGHRRDASRRAGRGARPQPIHRLGRHQRGGRRRGSLPRTPRRERDAAPSSAARRNRHGRFRKRSSSKARADADRRPRHASRPARLRRDQRESTPVATACRSRRRSSRSRSAGRRSTPTTRRCSRSCRLNEARNWSQFTACAARLRRAVAEFRLRRRRRPHRLLRARPHPDRGARLSGDGSSGSSPRAGPATRSGPAGFRSTICRTSTIRRSTSSSRPTIGRRPRRIRITSGSSGRSRTGRSGSPTFSRRQAGELTPDDFAAIQADTISLHAKTLCRVLLAHAQPDAAPERQAVEMLRGSGTSTPRRQRGGSDLRGVVLSARAALVGDELGPLTPRTTRTRFSFITRFVLAHARPAETAPGATTSTTAGARPATTR